MSTLYVKLGTETKSYDLTVTCETPYLHVANSLLPITTNTLPDNCFF